MVKKFVTYRDLLKREAEKLGVRPRDLMPFKRNPPRKDIEVKKT